MRLQSQTSRLDLALELTLALGLVLSPSTQLRQEQLPIGLSEIFLAGWVAFMGMREVLRLGPPITPALARIGMFWLLMTLALILGTLAGYVIGDVHDTGLFLHDAVAYPFLAAVSIFAVVEPGASGRLQRVAWLVATLGAGSLALQVLQGLDFIDLPLFDPWFWDRLRGWSANPNQLALFCAMLLPLSLHLAETSTNSTARLTALACGLISITAGLMSKSDTFKLVLVVVGLVLVAIKLRAWLLRSEGRVGLRFAVAGILALACPVLIGTGMVVASTMGEQIEAFAQGFSKEKPQGSEQEAEIRFAAWREAIVRGSESGMLGLGPGPHLYIPVAILAGRRNTRVTFSGIKHPDDNGIPNFEAHNTLLDLFTQGGLLAIAALVWLYGTTMLSIFKTRFDGLKAVLCSIAIFSTMHLIVRQPMFWFMLDLSLVMALGARTTAPTNGRG